MHGRSVSRLVLVALAALPLFGSSVLAAHKQDVLVVPARQRTVALAFDVRAMRDMVMITYRGTAATKTPLMHVWSPSANAWQELSAEAYAFGQFTPGQLGTLFLIGADRDLPASVIEGGSQAATVVRIDSISMAEIANTLNQHLSFSTREWAALAERHGLKTTDLNYERRKWGRFGPPRSDRPAEPAKSAFPDDELPQDIPEAPEPQAEPAPVQEPVPVAPPAPVIEPEQPAPFVLDASVGAPLEPEKVAVPVVVATPPVTPVVIEEKGATAALPTIGELLPEDK